MSDSPFIQDPLNPSPPSKLVERKIVVRPGQVNTVRLMHDPKDTDLRKWFVDGERQIRGGNEVKYLVRGDEAFGAMAEAIKLTAEPLDEPDPNHKSVIYLLGWSCDLEFQLIAGDPTSTLGELLRHASARGVEIRAMLWANMKGSSDPKEAFTVPQVKFINSLPTGRAILDAKTALLAKIVGLPIHRGSHHQKVLVTHGKRGLIAFCGGVDFCRDRVDAGGVTGLQDVHCQIRGPAAHDLMVLFANRWEDYLQTANPNPREHDLFPPRFPAPPPVPIPFPPLPIPVPIPREGAVDHSRDFLSAARIPVPGPIFGQQIVQTGRTTPKGLYPGFRPQGEQSIRKMILKGIESAQSFIYMEDQYLLNLECADALAKASAKPTLKYIIIVVPDDGAIDPEFLGLASFHRAEFVRRLRAGAGANKISIHCASRYTHSKAYIFDDKYAIIGSANCNRRGWEHDSEVVAGIFDESSESTGTLHFARRLRMKLWADHLNLAGAVAEPNRPSNTQDEFVELADGIASAAHWRKRLPSTRIRPYAALDHKGKSAQQVLEQAIHTRAGGNAQAAQFLLEIEALMAIKTVPESDVWDRVIDPPAPL